MDKLGQLYRERYGDRSRASLNASARIRAELFARWAGSGRKVLDVGGGSGQVGSAFVTGNGVTAIDIDKPALEAYRDRYGVEVVCRDFALELPFEDRSFDVVVAGEVLEHLPYPTIFMGEVARVLVAQGRFIGSVPNAYRYRNRVAFLRGRPFDTDPTHLRFFSLESLRSLLVSYFEFETIIPVRGKWSWLSVFAHNFAFCCRRWG